MQQVEHAIVNENIFINKHQSNNPHYKSQLQYHDHYELYFLLKGQRSYLINNDKLDLYPNDIILIKPGVIHQTLGSTFERLLVHFNIECFTNIFQKKFIDEIFNETPDYIITTANESIKSLFNKLHESYTQEKQSIIPLLTCEILLYIKENKQTRQALNINSNDLLGKILEYVNEGFNNINNLDEIANKFFISKYHLAHIFKKHLGTTTNTYLNNRKVSYAAMLLRTTNLNITEISIKSGFNSPAYFFKVFKTINLLSPIKYRKKYSEINKHKKTK